MKRFSFDDWLMPHFCPTQHYGAGHSCGVDALMTVTGLMRWQLRLKGDPLHTVGAMRRALRRHDWETRLFSGPKRIVNMSSNEYHWTADDIDKNHLFMFTADTTRQAASWFVLFQGEVFHNGKIISSSPLFALTNPVIDVLLLRKKRL